MSHSLKVAGDDRKTLCLWLPPDVVGSFTSKLSVSNNSFNLLTKHLHLQHICDINKKYCMFCKKCYGAQTCDWSHEGFFVRTPATRWGWDLPINSTRGCWPSACPCSTWARSVWPPTTPWRNGALRWNSSWWPTSTGAENTYVNTPLPTVCTTANSSYVKSRI